MKKVLHIKYIVQSKEVNIFYLNTLDNFFI